MAKEKIVRKGGTKKQKLQTSYLQLTDRLHWDLQKDLLRLFEESQYCDVELIVECNSIFTHSCILQARAIRFYSVLRSHFDPVENNGVSTIIIYNAAFHQIQQFIQSIYTNSFRLEVEDQIIQYIVPNKPRRNNVSAVTPESDVFFTPKCSPSEFPKPDRVFSSQELSLVRPKESDVTSYYKIVSVDDVPEETCPLEKELEEQDKLLQSLRSIISKDTKGKPDKPNSLPLSNLTSSHLAKKPNSRRPSLEHNRPSGKIVKVVKVPLWKPNPPRRDQNSEKKRKSQNDSIQERPRKVLDKGRTPWYLSGEDQYADSDVSASCYSPDMDLTGADSGLENSLSCQPEPSLRDNTVSETSGVDLTEAAMHGDTPSSPSSDAETWDTSKPIPKQQKQQGTKTVLHNGDVLNEEEMARLDAMERNMKECEAFLDMERKLCYGDGSVACDAFDTFASAEGIINKDGGNLNFSNDFYCDVSTVSNTNACQTFTQSKETAESGGTKTKNLAINGPCLKEISCSDVVLEDDFMETLPHETINNTHIKTNMSPHHHFKGNDTISQNIFNDFNYRLLETEDSLNSCDTMADSGRNSLKTMDVSLDSATTESETESPRPLHSKVDLVKVNEDVNAVRIPFKDDSVVPDARVEVPVTSAVRNIGTVDSRVPSATASNKLSSPVEPAMQSRTHPSSSDKAMGVRTECSSFEPALDLRTPTSSSNKSMELRTEGSPIELAMESRTPLRSCKELEESNSGSSPIQVAVESRSQPSSDKPIEPRSGSSPIQVAVESRSQPSSDKPIEPRSGRSSIEPAVESRSPLRSCKVPKESSSGSSPNELAKESKSQPISSDKSMEFRSENFSIEPAMDLRTPLSSSYKPDVVPRTSLNAVSKPNVESTPFVESPYKSHVESRTPCSPNQPSWKENLSRTPPCSPYKPTAESRMAASSLNGPTASRTPPSSPYKLSLMTVTPSGSACEASDEGMENKSDVSSVLNSCWDSSALTSTNYFIDASSLLDEDEITSPPVSLTNTDLQEEERRQGELIFKHSIPHFSRHEVVDENIQTSADSLHGGAQDTDERDDQEQVVPSSNITDLERMLEEAETPDSAIGQFHVEPTEEAAVAVESVASLPERVSSPARRVTAESLPIVSGGVSPKDFSNPPSHTSSPHLRRRNETAPILSGGMEFVEDKKAPRRKSSQNSGEAWVVEFTDRKPRGSSESEAETEIADAGSCGGDRTIPMHKKVQELKHVMKLDSAVGFFVDLGPEVKPTPATRSSFPVEKSASLGYFIEFDSHTEPKSPERVRKCAPQGKPRSNEKKNMFSMFIDISDDSSVSSGETKTRGKTSEEETNSDQTVVAQDSKKPFYMYIESESPVTKRRTPSSKHSNPVNTATFRRGHKRTQSYTISGDKLPTSADVSSTDNSLPFIETNASLTNSCYGKLSNGKSPVQADADTSKGTVWGENLKEESWVRTKDVQVTYSARDAYVDELTLKKDSTFILDSECGEKRYASQQQAGHRGNENLTTLDEGTPKSPFKSPKPEERDSGVVATEESDDSFVKLSDMDRDYKNPYISGDRRQEKHEKQERQDRMSQSVQEGSWIESKPTAKPQDRENREPLMSRSIATDHNVSRSLSRLFPNLNLSSSVSLARKSWSSVSPGAKHDTDPSDTQLSEMSSMQSSMEPSGLEISTSETDVSSHVGHTSRLGEDLLRMFLEEISPDVIVEVGGRRMKAHKCILSSRCQYFAAMLSGGWVESAGNVISLQGFSYNAVHFALCHIYSGESRIPDTLNIIELATLADMLCLEGLKEVITHTLKVKFCHCFHNPCSGCIVGVLDCLPVATAYGLDDLHRKCLRWITKHFVRVWPTKTFANLPKELLDKCYQHHVVHMTVENVLDTVLHMDKVRGSLPSVRWAEVVSRMVAKLSDAATKYIADHFSSVLTSDHFLALGRDDGWNVSRLEDCLLEATERLPPEQACWSHARLYRILSVVTQEQETPSDMSWTESFIELLQCIAGHVENSLIKQAPRAARSKAWRQMEPELRSKIQEAACLVLPDDTRSPGHRRPAAIKRDAASSLPSSFGKPTNRVSDLRLVRLAMTQQSVRSTSSANRQSFPPDHRLTSLKPIVTAAVAKKAETSLNLKRMQPKSAAEGHPDVKKVTPSRFLEVKSRYLEQKSPQKAVEKPALVNVRRAVRPISSSDSSRNCSPAMRRANLRASPGKKCPPACNPRSSQRSSLTSNDSNNDKSRPLSYVSTRSDTPSVKTLSRLTVDETMSTDSLATESSLSEKDAQVQRREQIGKENIEECRRPVGIALAVPKTRYQYQASSTKRSYSETSVPSTLRTQHAVPASKKTIITVSKPAETKSNLPKRTAAPKLSGANQGARISPSRSSLASPRTATARNVLQRTTTRNNGNTTRRRTDVDVENNERNRPPQQQQSTLKKAAVVVSRSGTFLKDEPTILKKPQGQVVEDEF